MTSVHLRDDADRRLGGGPYGASRLVCDGNIRIVAAHGSGNPAWCERSNDPGVLRFYSAGIPAGCGDYAKPRALGCPICRAAVINAEIQNEVIRVCCGDCAVARASAPSVA